MKRAIVKSRGSVALFVTFAHPCAGIPDAGRVIASSERLTATRPSVGGVRFDLELLTSKILTMPWAMCDSPSGAGMKHTTP